MSAPRLKPVPAIAPEPEVSEAVIVRPQFTDEEIAQRAHEIFVREGCVHGKHEQHWFQAIAELTAEAR